MRYLSLFSGIEAASVAWHALGWTPVAFAEIEPHPCALLAERFPNVPNLGDVTKITDEMIEQLGPIDVVIGGSPCQDLSVAGNRAGLSGARSSLFHEQVRIFHAARSFCGARWCVWENVPGAFSSNGGSDFAVVVGTLAGCDFRAPREGWGCEGVAMGANGLVEWSMLDAQWFGLAQRRDRVFAVLDSGNWHDRPPVLLEPESLRGHSAPRRGTGERIAPCIEARADAGGAGWGTDFLAGGGLAAEICPTLRAGGNATGGDRPPGTDVDTCVSLIPEVAWCLQERDAKGADSSTKDGHLIPCAIQAGALRENPSSGPDGVGVQEHIAYPLEARAEVQAVVFDERNVTSPTNRSNPQPGAPCCTLHKPQDAILTVAHPAMQVRRLTPRECERLQGFPDDWTLITHRGKPAADGPRYRALGNSMAVPVITWIGKQLERAHNWTEA